MASVRNVGSDFAEAVVIYAVRIKAAPIIGYLKVHDASPGEEVFCANNEILDRTFRLDSLLAMLLFRNN